jgi:ParB family chromosome partitioning protein
MTKKRGLGKSLDALLVGSSPFAEDETGSSSGGKKGDLQQLPIDSLQRGKYQPRRDMNPEALEELANSIRTQGVIQPIVVRHLLGGRYEIVAGERRWRAAQLAGLKEIPAVIKDIPDQAAIAIALIENIQRENLNPIEEAMALQRLLEEFSMTHQQVAEAVGKSRATVTNLLRLLALPDEVKKLLEHGDLEMGHARALLALPMERQLEAAKMIASKGLSVREAEALVRLLQLPRAAGHKQAVDPDVRRLQQDLSTRIKLPVVIQHSVKGNGKLVIRYKTLSELDVLLEYLQA